MLVPLLIAAGRKSQDLGSRAGSPAALPAAPTAGAHLGWCRAAPHAAPVASDPARHGEPEPL